MGACCSHARTERRTSDDKVHGTKKDKTTKKDGPKYHKGSTNDDDEAADTEATEDVYQKSSISAHIALTEVQMELININISQIDGESQKLPVMNTLTVSQMKQLIAKHIGIPEHKQHLIYNDEILDNTKTIWFYEIKNGDTIDLSILEHHDIVEIIVDYKSGTIKKTIFISANSTFIEFRKEVQGKIPNVSLMEQQFFYNDIQLTDDDKLLNDYGLENKSVLRFEWKSAV